MSGVSGGVCGASSVGVVGGFSCVDGVAIAVDVGGFDGSGVVGGAVALLASVGLVGPALLAVFAALVALVVEAVLLKAVVGGVAGADGADRVVGV